ncbi:MAG: IS982 family transposase [Sulfurovum sp.]|nr:IS982 family transposase [Sulfurovum sp.]
MITKIFCDIDDFMQGFEPMYKQKMIEDKTMKTKLHSKLSMSEIMTIVVYFHRSGYRTFKDFYIKYILKSLKEAFPNIVSYNRFIELIPTVFLPLVAFLKLKRLVKSDNITFIDSTKIAICKNKRIKVNRVFKGLAERGKSTMGWFYGFKLHIAINEKGELVGASISKGNVDDRDVNVLDGVLENASGKLYADKGYISKKLFEYLYKQGITLVTNVKKNMKNRLMLIMDKLLLRKRSVIETVNDQLKNLCDIEHSRSRSPVNFMVNMIAGLIRYTYSEKLPSINFSQKDIEILGFPIFKTPLKSDENSVSMQL